MVIQGPKHFAEYANSVLKKIKVLYIEFAESGYHDECRQKALPVAGTLKVHKIVRCITAPGSQKLIFYDISTTAAQTKLAEKEYMVTPTLW